MKKFRRLAFKIMADELKNPTDHKQRERHGPPAGDENRGDKEYDGERDHGNAERVAETIDGMLMALRILRDPFGHGFIAEHVFLFKN